MTTAEDRMSRGCIAIIIIFGSVLLFVAFMIATLIKVWFG